MPCWSRPTLKKCWLTVVVTERCCFKWCFLDVSALVYDPLTPEQAPLGGSQSALCYLSRELAARGHAVSLINARKAAAEVVAGVHCLGAQQLSADFWRAADFDLVVSLNRHDPLAQLRPLTTARLIFWNQHNLEVPDVQDLAASLPLLDALVFVSDWQQQAYAQRWQLEQLSCRVLRNAVAPVMLQPAAVEQVLARKSRLPSLVYTSSPGRGLGVLLAMFPLLKQLFPQLELKVCASLAPYQAPAAEEQAFSPLYQECQRLPGVSYLGGLSQAALAEVLAGSQILAYPNTYAETSCIAMLEALAQGCRVVTSALGALPESSAGFARLVPFGELKPFAVSYFEALKQEILSYLQAPPHSQLRAQIQQIRQAYQWSERAAEWEQMACQLLASKP